MQTPLQQLGKISHCLSTTSDLPLNGFPFRLLYVWTVINYFFPTKIGELYERHRQRHFRSSEALFLYMKL
jgi:hypothetical protein